VKPETVVDKASFEAGPFKADGGFARLDKVIDGKVGELAEEVWKDAGGATRDAPSSMEDAFFAMEASLGRPRGTNRTTEASLPTRSASSTTEEAPSIIGRGSSTTTEASLPTRSRLFRASVATTPTMEASFTTREASSIAGRASSIAERASLATTEASLSSMEALFATSEASAARKHAKSRRRRNRTGGFPGLRSIADQ